jgi:hypothetical protein
LHLVTTQRCQKLALIGSFHALRRCVPLRSRPIS